MLRTLRLGLSGFAGQSIVLRFVTTRTSGNFWFDLDNINILACAADMNLSANVIPADPGQSNGVATIQVGLGNPPYQYNWSNGATGQTIETLGAGVYMVTVTDALGCSDSFEFNVGLSAVKEIPGLNNFTVFPNPSQGLTHIQAVFNKEIVQANLQIVNTLGQVIWSKTIQNKREIQESIDLSHAPGGLYLIRLETGGSAISRKLLLE
jgi:hypothetical protein